MARLGEHDLVVSEGTEEEVVVRRAITHPAYNRDTVRDSLVKACGDNICDQVDNDVALLELPRPALLGPHTGLACLPRPGQPPPPPQHHCTIIGWGKQSKQHYYGTEVLHEARVPIVSMSDCMSVYKNYYITDNMFCAGYRGGRVDSCAGDSGGPLLCRGADHRCRNLDIIYNNN